METTLETENNTRAGSRHRMGWLLLPLLLPVLYVLLLAPFDAWVLREQLSDGLSLSFPQPKWVAQLNAPMEWAVAHSRLANEGWGLYKRWWIEMICGSLLGK